MEKEVIEFFKFHRKMFCEDYLKKIPKDSIAYQATLKEKEFYDKAIKALEREPSEDAVSRKDLYNALYERFHDEDAPNNITEVRLGAVRNFVKNFPSVTPANKWIPVSERLPDAQKDGDKDFSDWVQVTINLGKDNPSCVSEAYYCFSADKWYTERLVIGEVIAWQSLPKPYKTESEEK